MDNVKAWLDDINMTYTHGPKAILWNTTIQAVLEDEEYFWDDVDEDGNAKDVGWNFLAIEDVSIISMYEFYFLSLIVFI